jgi:ubiquinone/menaquinone biosynthesis C-methylase UbiE
VISPGDWSIVSAMRLTFRLLVLACLPALGWAQVAAEANKAYQTPEGRARLIKTLDDPHRPDTVQAKELVKLLHIAPGSTVADVGTGTGMMLPFLVEAVGPGGRVIAEDIQTDFLSRTEARIQSIGWKNVTAVLGTDRNPNLPAGQVDLVFILDAYHHFDYPEEMLGHISRALKPGGRLAVADFYRHRRNAQGKDMSDHVRADRDEVRREIESSGFELLSNHDHATNQYLLIFRKR